MATNSGIEEYAALLAAMDKTEPVCMGDDLFIRDREDVTPEEQEDMRQTCAQCPLYDLCRAYGEAAHPTGGYWAGRYYGSATRRRTGD
ncbi:WhiB family transcriptional regulator [Microbacterium sulfonylureivorans]|uniref:WhiB family transcriptional regulator n=1 Tax=Microbacterium sulfonylureivorans TaxID=2486854 RepID=UPI000FD8E597|nr:WhiB family transcriptional regulator [Microbacterium sulfonylureivorans]